MARQPVLDSDSLRRLRELLGRLRGEDLASVPFDRLLALATELKIDAGLTVDLDAAEQLGQPVVIVRLPGQTPVSTRFNELSVREGEVA